jgi:signal transduction histidine kinase
MTGTLLAGFAVAGTALLLRLGDGTNSAPWPLWHRPGWQFAWIASTALLGLATAVSAITAIGRWAATLPTLVLMTAPAFAAWQAAPTTPRVAALALLSLAPAAGLAAVGIEGSDRRRFAVIALLSGGTGLALLATWEPLADRDCTLICGSSSLVLVQIRHARDTFGGIALLIGVLVAGSIAAAALHHSLARRRRGDRSEPSALINRLTIVGSASTAVGFPLLLVIGPNDDGGVLPATAGPALLGLAILGRIALVLRRRRRVERLIAGLDAGADPDVLASGLRTALGSSIRVAFRRTNGELIDAGGLPTTPAGSDPNDSGGEGLWMLLGAGPAIRLTGDDTVDASDLPDRLSPTASLLLTNAALTAELRAEFRDLRAAQRRSLAAADAARARSGRDLHDGVQHLLLGAVIELGLASDTLRASNHLPAARLALERARAPTQAALADLRRIAHGLYPATLDEVGLVEALHEAADEAGVTLVVQGDPPARFPAELEMTLFGWSFRSFRNKRIT